MRRVYGLQLVYGLQRECTDSNECTDFNDNDEISGCAMSAIGRSVSSLEIRSATNAENWLLDGFPCLIQTRQRHILSFAKGKIMMSAVNVIPGLAQLTHHLNNIPMNLSIGDLRATSRVGFTNSSTVLVESKHNVFLVERKLLSKQSIRAWGVG